MSNNTGIRLTPGDVFGGLAGAAVALPQSMGLGVVLFTSIGMSASSGALAGLIGAATLSVVSGLGGYTRGMISAPNGPVTMILSASMAAIGMQGISADGLLAALGILVILAGLIQLIIGLSGGGQLVKFIPYPMVAGLVTAVGILMIRSQIDSLWPAFDNDNLSLWAMIPAATATLTFAAIQLTSRFLPQVPGVIGGLFAGLASFHLAVAASPTPMPEAWVVGTIPNLSTVHLSLTSTAFQNLPWDLLLPWALALAVLASIDCLVTAVVADSATKTRHDARGELVSQGIGHILTGLLGGLGGGGTKGSTLVAIGAGGRRWPALIAGITFLTLGMTSGAIGRYLPISVLAGVIFFVGFSMLEWRLLLWLRRPRTRIDGALALIVVATTLYYNLIVGVGVGALGAMLLFIRGQIRAPMVQERGTGRERRSLRLRSESDHALLDAHGDRIIYLELRGDLFFGTVDRLFTELAKDLDRPIWIVVNMRRVQSLDLTGLDLFRQMTARVRSHGGQMLFANIHRGAAHGHNMDKLLRAFPGEHAKSGIKTSFKSTDKALERAEDLLLTALGHPPGPTEIRVEVESNKLFQGADVTVLATLRPLMQSLVLPRKSRPFSIGDFGDAIYFVQQGLVDIRLPVSNYHYKRLNSIGPGGYFGEIGFLQPGPHSASAVIARDAELLMLSRSAIGSLDNPAVRQAVTVLELRLAGSLVKDLRKTRADLARLERW